MLDSLFTVATSTELTFTNALLTIFIAIVLGGIISYTYMKTNASGYSQSFTLTMVLLPVIVAIIILLIGSNVARASVLPGRSPSFALEVRRAIRRISHLFCSPWLLDLPAEWVPLDMQFCSPYPMCPYVYP